MKRRKIVTMTGLGGISAFLTPWLHQFTSVNSEINASNLSLPPFSITDSELSSIPIDIDWNKTIARTTPLVFGSNDYEITKPQKANDALFQDLLNQLDIGLIRIHHHDLVKRWTDETTKTWDEVKIKAGFDASYPQNPTLVQNIPRWPKWMNQDEAGLLATAEYDNYANFCAELVTIINQRQQRKVLYWEPFNELEKRYEKQGKLDQLWEIYNRTAMAMKAADPQIKVGGPALTWDNRPVLADFLQNCGSNVDFISWHRYGTGNAGISTDKLMSNTSRYKKQVHKFRSVAAKYASDRRIPLFLSEYNINYSWKSGEMRQNSHIGAVWFASVLKHLTEAEIDMATSWHLKDGIYGMIDPKNNLRPAAQVFAWGNKYLIGKVVATQSQNDAVEALAVEQDDGRRSLLLINKSSRSTQVNLQFTPNILSEKTISGFTLDQSGIANLTDAATMVDSPPLILQPLSLLLLRFG